MAKAGGRNALTLPTAYAAGPLPLPEGEDKKQAVVGPMRNASRCEGNKPNLGASREASWSDAVRTSLQVNGA